MQVTHVTFLGEWPAGLLSKRIMSRVCQKYMHAHTDTQRLIRGVFFRGGKM